MPTRVHALAALAFAASLAAAAAPPAFSAFSIEQVLGAPFPSELQAARQGERIAWVLNRRGERNVQQTIVDPRQGSHPVSVTPTDDGMSVGVQRGQQPNAPGMPTRESSPDTPHTQMEISDAEDSFEVYQGNVSNPLDTVPGFRSRAKD